MDIIDMARASGLTVVLDGRIGREEYQSVCGSVSALMRFAETLRQCAANQNNCVPHRSRRSSERNGKHAIAAPLRRTSSNHHRSLT